MSKKKGSHSRSDPDAQWLHVSPRSKLNQGALSWRINHVKSLSISPTSFLEELSCQGFSRRIFRQRLLPPIVCLHTDQLQEALEFLLCQRLCKAVSSHFVRWYIVDINLAMLLKVSDVVVSNINVL